MAATVSPPRWHPRIVRGLVAVARLAGPTDGAMNLLTATGAIQTREHTRALIREIRRTLADPAPAVGSDADARRDLSLFAAILPSAPANVCFTD
jgi:hypothetical protein